MLILAVMHQVIWQLGLMFASKKVQFVFCSTLYEELSDDRLRVYFMKDYK